MTDEPIRDPSMDQPLSPWLIVAIPLFMIAFLGVWLFPAAGDWGWLEGWAVILCFALLSGIAYAIINQVNPRVLRNRMKVKKEGLTEATSKPAGSDRYIMPAMSVGFFGALIVSALAHRFGWPKISLPIAIVGLVLSSAGMVVMYVAMHQNAYASKLLDINEGQVLVDTGLYGRVRHPLYAGGVIMFLGLPIALGSWWGLIPAALAAGALVARIKSEEEMLVKGMEGYEDYRARVRYKLIPGIY